ncbi:MAG TPA: hypothetical protein VHN16_02900 [Streptosporangiaceae bacterium]|nr:hypothetical protein [Streptosporangiaceae bacterium]
MPRHCVSDDPKYQLAGDDWEWVMRTVDGLGSLTNRQRDLVRLLRDHRRA